MKHNIIPALKAVLFSSTLLIAFTGCTIKEQTQFFNGSNSGNAVDEQASQVYETDTFQWFIQAIPDDELKKMDLTELVDEYASGNKTIDYVRLSDFWDAYLNGDNVLGTTVRVHVKHIKDGCISSGRNFYSYINDDHAGDIHVGDTVTIFVVKTYESREGSPCFNLVGVVLAIEHPE